MRSEVFKLYENRDDVTLTSYIIADSPELMNGKKRPAILVCPGGAYLNCSDREGEPIALRFAAMGYHAFVLRYSTYFEGKSGFPQLGQEIPPKQHCVHPAPMRDIGKAFLKLHENADQWLLDTDRIAICGFSAGAHNCAMYSVYWYAPVMTEFFRQPANKFKPAATILAYTLSDYVLLADAATGQLDPLARGLFELSVLAFTGTTKPSRELLAEVSPARQVNDQTPPMFLWATAADSLVPVAHSTIMATALATHKIPFEIHIFEEGMHGLSLADQASSGSWSQNNPDAAKWVGLAEAWLKKRFALPLPEKSDWEILMESNKQ